MILYRPTGQKEAELIIDSGMRRFPPRLPEQPIFYPVCNEEYAKTISSQWNTRDGIAYVFRFEIDDEYAAKFNPRIVGSKEHEELWVMAEELEEFNKHIVGDITIVATFPMKAKQ